MSKDPYHTVQHDVESSLQSLSTLKASYLRIQSTARGETEELSWARNELESTLESLDADVDDLEESVKIVESTGARMFGLDDAEVSKRRAYVKTVRAQLATVRAEISGQASYSKSVEAEPSSHMAQGDEEDHEAAWSEQEQQLMMQEQDKTMDSIVGTLTNLAQQAGLMGQEILVHNELLEDLEEGVDRTDSKLSGQLKKIRQFVRQTEETKSGCCIIILIIVLVALLFAVILS